MQHVLTPAGRLGRGIGRTAQRPPQRDEVVALQARRLHEDRKAFPALVGQNLRARRGLHARHVADLLGQAARQAFLGGALDGLLDVFVFRAGDGGAVALAALDELQRLAHGRILPALLGGHGEQVHAGLLQDTARHPEALEDLLAVLAIGPPEHGQAVAGAQFLALDQQADIGLVRARHHEDALQRGLREARPLVGQQRLHHVLFEILHDRIHDRVGDLAPLGHLAAVGARDLVGDLDQVAVGQALAFLEDVPGDLDVVLGQHDQDRARRLVEHHQPLGHALAQLDVGIAQKLHQHVARHVALLRRQLRGRDADDVRQALCEQPAHMRLARRRVVDEVFRRALAQGRGLLRGLIRVQRCRCGGCVHGGIPRFWPTREPEWFTAR